jgi:hypothetical protein
MRGVASPIEGCLGFNNIWSRLSHEGKERLNEKLLEILPDTVFPESP